MIVRFLLAALAAGLLAGIVMTPVHYRQVAPLILQAEAFEAAGGHSHAAAQETGAVDAVKTNAPEPAASAAAEKAQPVLGRLWNTALTNLVTGAGLALLMAGVSLISGVPVRASTGLAWGAAGWLAAQFLPGLGLPPELPGFPYVDLQARQTWWLATVAASTLGMSLLFLRKEIAARMAGIVLLIAPHIYGAPQPAAISGSVPAYLAAQFVMAALSTTLFFWLALGLLLGFFMDRSGKPA